MRLAVLRDRDVARVGKDLPGARDHAHDAADDQPLAGAEAARDRRVLGEVRVAFRRRRHGVRLRLLPGHRLRAGGGQLLRPFDALDLIVELDDGAVARVVILLFVGGQ